MRTPFCCDFWRSVVAARKLLLLMQLHRRIAQRVGQGRFTNSAAHGRSRRFRGVLESLHDKSIGTKLSQSACDSASRWPEKPRAVVGTVAEFAVRNGDRSAVRSPCRGRCTSITWSPPRSIEAHMESGAMSCLSAVLYGEISVNPAKLQELNFDTYRVVRQAEAPRSGLSRAVGRLINGAVIGECAPRPWRPAHRPSHLPPASAGALLAVEECESSRSSLASDESGPYASSHTDEVWTRRIPGSAALAAARPYVTSFVGQCSERELCYDVR